MTTRWMNSRGVCGGQGECSFRRAKRDDGADDRHFTVSFCGVAVHRLTAAACWLALVVFCCRMAQADDFTEIVQPYVNRYCLDCHNASEARGELDFTKFKAPRDVIDNFRRWSAVVEFVHSGEMPPADAPQPPVAESAALTTAIRSILTTEARRRAGDPGLVPARRLSHSEYDRSIRDLTGIDIRPTRDFPADPAAGEGFDNTGEALSIGPGLVRKYLAAAQFTADHLVLHTTGLRFAPFVVTSGNERRKLTEQAVIDFYRQHEVDLADHIEAAWRFRFRPDSAGTQTAAEFALLNRLSPDYFTRVVEFFSGLPELDGCPVELRDAWLKLAPADPTAVTATSRSAANVAPPAELQELLRLISHYRRLLHAPEGELIKANAGNWPIGHLDFRARTAAVRTAFSTARFQNSALLKSAPISAAPEKNPDQSLVLVLRLTPQPGTTAGALLLKRPVFSRADRLPRNEAEATEHQIRTLRDVLASAPAAQTAPLPFGQDLSGAAIDADSLTASAPAELQFVLTAEQRRQLQGHRLLLPLELSSPEAAVNIQLGLAATAADATAAAAAAPSEMLASPDSPWVQNLRPFAEEFCKIFPDRFFYVDPGRGLEAGFHLVEGFFRDDLPLMRLVLSEQQRTELDGLWTELEFVNTSAETLLRGFVWFERSEREVLHDKRFEFLRSEDPELIREEILARFETLYLEKLGLKRDAETGAGLDDRSRMVLQFFADIRRGLQLQQDRLAAAEPRGIADLLKLADKAWRRPLTSDEQQELQELYKRFRGEGQSVEQALRGVFTAVLLSPHFCCLWQTPADGPGVSPLNSWDLASRLSYFMWSSLPDADLRQAAADGRLETADGVAAEAQRMLVTPKVNALAEEFFGQWLRYRDFEQKDPINAAAFPGYDDKLRAAMAEEPVQMAAWLIRQDKSVLELLSGDTTLLNARLAAHYGGLLQQRYRAAADQRRHELAASGASAAVLASIDEEWLPVDGLREAGRGGLFGMSVVLAKNSAGERSSPVKRGFWTVHHLLGRHFPPPPADVPELPKSEQLADRSLRELLKAHVSDTQCALCHRHFDHLGLTMEGFDAIGRARTKDAAGRPIDARVLLADGSAVEGIPGLADYVVQQRRSEFLQTLCRRFLGYALGRSVQLSDQSLLEQMQAALEAGDGRFSILVDQVVRSPQFRMVRNREFSTAGP